MVIRPDWARSFSMSIATSSSVPRSTGSETDFPSNWSVAAGWVVEGLEVLIRGGSPWSSGARARQRKGGSGLRAREPTPRPARRQVDGPAGAADRELPGVRGGSNCMSPSRAGARVIVLCLLAAAVLALPVPAGARGAWAAPAADTMGESPPWTNVRPFFGMGYTGLGDFGALDHGFGASLGFEIEGSPHLSYLFRAEWNRLQGEATYSYYPTYPGSYTILLQETVYTWTVGARVHLRSQGRVRPYTECDLGLRLYRARDTAHLTSGVGLGHGGEALEGFTVALRFGLTTARPERGGLFLDAGIETMGTHMDRQAMVPIRFGVTFP